MSESGYKNTAQNLRAPWKPPVPPEFGPSEFKKHPLQITKEIMAARENWDGLAYEEKLRITQMTHAILPESFRPEKWEEEKETLKTYYNHVPPIVDHFISLATEDQVLSVLNRFFAKKQLEQGGNPANLEGLKIEGKEGEEVILSDDLIHRLDDLRRKKN